MKKFLHNYHTHTALCHHASGSIKDYVDAAVERGMKTIGFSCHAPYPFGDRFHSWYRMTPEENTVYAEEILALKKEYEGKIDVKLGYEAEYYPAFWDKLLDEIRRYPCDYIILGQHFLNNEYDGCYSGNWFDDVRSVKAYARILCEAMRTGLYTYVAHPDLVNFAGSMEDYVEAMRPVCEVSLETDTPLEINLLGIRGERSYPKEAFWRTVGEYGCKVVFGSDAHSPAELTVTSDFVRACEFVEKYSLNYIENVPLKSVFQK